MTPYKLNLLICRAPYGGNGGISNEYPAVSNWLVETMNKIQKDQRIGRVEHVEITDTPVTMVRNRFVKLAREKDCDLILMIDSDQVPDYDLSLGDATQKPFWDTSFDFLYDHYPKGPAVVFAPYCGMSPHQNVFVFQWKNFRNNEPDQGFKMGPYEREEAFRMAGIQPVAAGPTGLILFDRRCFDLVEPPYFYYEYKEDGGKCDHCGCRKPGMQDEKASTEDVTATRDIAMAGQQSLGYNPVFCNWDSWAGHVKQEIVGKPRPLTHDQVNSKFVKAVTHPVALNEKIIHVNADKKEIYVPHGSCVEQSTSKAADCFSWIEQQDANSTPIDRDVLRGLVSGLASKKSDTILAAELGSFVGQSAKVIVSSAPDKIHLVCVDTWVGMNEDMAAVNTMRYDTFAAFKENCKAELESNQIEILRGMTRAVGKVLLHNNYAGKFDFVFVDADHSYESVKADIETWIQLVADGGVICGHDFDLPDHQGGIMFPGVRKAVEEIFGDDFERPKPGSSIWSHVVKKSVTPESAAPIATNGHAKKPRQRKLARR